MPILSESRQKNDFNQHFHDEEIEIICHIGCIFSIMVFIVIFFKHHLVLPNNRTVMKRIEVAVLGAIMRYSKACSCLDTRGPLTLDSSREYYFKKSCSTGDAAGGDYFDHSRH